MSSPTGILKTGLFGGGCVETLRVGLLGCERVVMAVQGTRRNRSGISTRGLKHHGSCRHILPALTSQGCEDPEQGKVKKQILLSYWAGPGSGSVLSLRSGKDPHSLQIHAEHPLKTG